MELSMRHEGMLQHVAILVQETRAIELALADLEKKVSALQEEWSGDAQNAYRQAQLQWSKAARNMTRSLAVIADGAMRSHVLMWEAQRAANRVWDWG